MTTPPLPQKTKLRLPRCPKCYKNGPEGLCQAHAKWYADMVCMDCSVPLTDENYAQFIVAVGLAKEPWEDEAEFDVIVRIADTVEAVCESCKQKRLEG